MSTCPDCGSPLRFGQLDDELIPLEPHEAMRGENRYVFEGDTDRLVSVTPTADVLAWVDHRTVCPARAGR